LPYARSSPHRRAVAAFRPRPAADERLDHGGSSRRVIAIAALLAACWSGACTRPAESDAIVVSWSLEPSHAAVGTDTRTVVRLADADGQPVTGATLEIEAHMSHPGMAPVVARAVERAAGVYEAQVAFTMAGPWTLVASGTLADGRRVMKTFEVPEVR
jgi:hypothetical protein